MLSITINYDVEQYQESVLAGLNARQTLAAVLALMTGTGLVCLLSFRFGLPVDMSIYISMPFCIPIILPALGRKNGLTIWQRFARGSFHRRKKLLYGSTESRNEL